MGQRKRRREVMTPHRKMLAAAKERRAARETAKRGFRARERWFNLVFWPMSIIGLVVAFPVLLFLLVRIMRTGLSGSAADSAIEKAWAFAFLAGLVVCLLALLAGASVGIWWLLK